MNYVEMAKTVNTEDMSLKAMLDKVAETGSFKAAFDSLKGTEGFLYKNAFLFEKSMISKLNKITAGKDVKTTSKISKKETGISLNDVLNSEEISSKDKKTLKIVVDGLGVKTLSELSKKTKVELVNLPGIGEKTVNSLADYLKEKYNVELSDC